MKILLIGNTGQLGWELQRTLAPLGEVVAIDFPDIDLTDETQTRQLVRHTHPQLIVNAAAYTAVDQAENERPLAHAVNSYAPRLLAEEADRLGGALIHFSTDYVFDGKKGAPYEEEDRPNPINTYGRSKLEGENGIQQVNGSYLILRTSWVYSTRRPSFVTKVLGWSRKHSTLRIVSDQVSNPTWCRMLAEATAQLIAKGHPDIAPWIEERRGIYHLAGDGIASRLKWAEAILALDPAPEEHTAQEILPANTADFPTPALRPLYSALNCNRFTNTFGLRLPGWKEALRLAMGELS